MFEHVPHPHIARRRSQGPHQTAHEHVGLSGRLALLITNAVSTMACAGVFALLAILGFPTGPHVALPAYVQWFSQTFIQLVMLSIIMVGQRVSGSASDKRAVQQFEDVEAILHGQEQIVQHLARIDERLDGEKSA